eukprot:990783-Amphidinium_carterae.1
MDLPQVTKLKFGEPAIEHCHQGSPDGSACRSSEPAFRCATFADNGVLGYPLPVSIALNFMPFSLLCSVVAIFDCTGVVEGKLQAALAPRREISCIKRI